MSWGADLCHEVNSGVSTNGLAPNCVQVFLKLTNGVWIFTSQALQAIVTESTHLNICSKDWARSIPGIGKLNESVCTLHKWFAQDGIISAPLLQVGKWWKKRKKKKRFWLMAEEKKNMFIHGKPMIVLYISCAVNFTFETNSVSAF